VQISASKASKVAAALKKKAKAKAKRSSGKKSRSDGDDVSHGITDFLELAAVVDFYEVRSRAFTEG